LDVGAKEETRYSIRTRIRLFEEVVVAARPVGRRELVTAPDIRLERRELSSSAMKAFTRIEDVTGKQTARAISANEVVTENLLDVRGCRRGWESRRVHSGEKRYIREIDAWPSS
jgi:flagella basal body P-ring formation protein FlgA